jgi:hypothetical protein
MKLHLVKEMQDNQLLIGNNIGKINAWVPATAAIGRVIEVEPCATVVQQ